MSLSPISLFQVEFSETPLDYDPAVRSSCDKGKWQPRMLLASTKEGHPSNEWVCVGCVRERERVCRAGCLELGQCVSGLKPESLVGDPDRRIQFNLKTEHQTHKQVEAKILNIIDSTLDI